MFEKHFVKKTESLCFFWYLKRKTIRGDGHTEACSSQANAAMVDDTKPGGPRKFTVNYMLSSFNMIGHDGQYGST